MIYQYGNDSIFQPEQRARYPASTQIGKVPRLPKVQYSRRGVGRGPNSPPPTEPETVSATRMTHSTGQIGLSKGPEAPLSRQSMQSRSRGRLESEGSSTCSVQQTNPHSSTDKGHNLKQLVDCSCQLLLVEHQKNRLIDKNDLRKSSTSLSRGPDYPTYTRIEAVLISQEAQIRRAAHAFSTAGSPLQ